jgi:hypothetical protein
VLRHHAFGQKHDNEGQLIDFDDLYEFMIKESVEALGVTCIRSDEISESGMIHREMIEHTYTADIAVVDITTLNPNVFYELGVRHALRKSITVLIRQKGTKLPFNIQGLNVIEYDTANWPASPKPRSGSRGSSRTDSPTRIMSIAWCTKSQAENRL